MVSYLFELAREPGRVAREHAPKGRLPVPAMLAVLVLACYAPHALPHAWAQPWRALSSYAPYLLLLVVGTWLIIAVVVHTSAIVFGRRQPFGHSRVVADLALMLPFTAVAVVDFFRWVDAYAGGTAGQLTMGAQVEGVGALAQLFALIWMTVLIAVVVKETHQLPPLRGAAAALAAVVAVVAFSVVLDALWFGTASS